MLPAENERAKYEDIWQLPAYAENSPGDKRSTLFGQIANPSLGDTLIDLGCGKGVGGKKLESLYGVDVTYLDITRAGDGSVEPFLKQPLWEPIPPIKGGRRTWQYNYGYCVDVMEHIPTEFTMLAVRNMLAVCKYVFFGVSFLPDYFGPAFVGQQLHLTIKDFTWWRDHFSEMGQLLDGRDLLGSGVYYVKA